MYNKITTLTIVIIISISTSTLGQNLVLKDGEVIRYDKLKMKGDSFEVTFNEKSGNELISCSEILGDYSSSDLSMSYLIPIQGKSKVNYIFADRILEGEIPVYERVVTSYSYSQYGGTSSYSQYGGTSSSNVYLYFYIDGKYELMLTTGVILQKKKELKKKLSEYISDDKEARATLNSSEFYYKYSNLVSLMKSYNLRTYTPQKKPLKDEWNSVTIYRRNKRQSKEVLNIVIEKESHPLEVDNFVEIEIPSNSTIKVCFKEISFEECRLMQSNPYFVKSFELSLNKDKKLKLLPKDKKETKFYLDVIQWRKDKEAKKARKQ